MTPDLTCHRCHSPAFTRDSQGRDWCMRCVADEAGQRRPYAKVACEALEVLGYGDLAREVQRRMGVLVKSERLPFDDSPPYVELVQ